MIRSRFLCASVVAGLLIWCGGLSCHRNAGPLAGTRTLTHNYLAEQAGEAQQSIPCLATEVVPIDWSRFAVALDGDTHYRQCARLLVNCARYNIAWIITTFEKDRSRDLYLLTDMREHGVRPATSVIYAMAVLLKTGAYDAGAVGVPKEQAQERIIRLLRGVAATHKVNGDARAGWGHSWQSALWAAQLGFGSWLLWDALDIPARRMISNLVVDEADRFLDYQAPYWNGRSGDTKAGENSWNSMILNVAVAMMPGHPHVSRWKAKSSELMVSSYATERDWKENETVLDGRPVREWLNGYNALDGGVVINHGFIHPDYMVAETMNLWAFTTQSLAGLAVPQTASFNGALIYKTLTTRQWNCPPYHSPGGTIYIPEQPEIYYPKGVDWSTHDLSPYYLIDVWAHVLAWDRELDQKAAPWMELRADKMLQMQRRHDDHHMFASGEYDTYPGAEQWVTWCIADAFLILWMQAQDAIGQETNWLNAAPSILPKSR